jgi:signal peptidase I
VNRAAYDLRFPYSSFALLKFGDPKVGDMVLLRLLDDRLALKRVVAGPGSRVAMHDNHLIIDGRTLDYRLVADNERPLVERGPLGSVIEIERGNGPNVVVSHTPGTGLAHGFEERPVLPAMYFVLGSNRDINVDSRSFGLVARNRILGKVVARVWSAPR